MALYRKKPVVIEAFQMTYERRWDNREWPEWLNVAWNAEHGEGAMWPDPDGLVRPDRGSPDRLVLGTLEGVHRITFGDYIIRGVKGELYPCKPDVFDATYEYADAVRVKAMQIAEMVLAHTTPPHLEGDEYKVAFGIWTERVRAELDK